MFTMYYMYMYGVRLRAKFCANKLNKKIVPLGIIAKSQNLCKMLMLTFI